MEKNSPSLVALRQQRLRAFRQSTVTKYQRQRGRDPHELDLLQFENSKRRDKAIKAKQNDIARKTREHGARLRSLRMA